ncbi:MAG: GGDEF domain-containing protein [Sulfuricella sp.]
MEQEGEASNKGGEASRFAAIRRDDSGRKNQEEPLARVARYDLQTALPNRELFFQRLEQVLAENRRQNRKFALIFIGLDDLDAVNDGYGQRCRDALLHEVASRLKKGIRGSDTLARLGGDEFAVILPILENSQDAKRVAAQLLEQFRTPFILEGHPCRITASIGISRYPEDGDETETLLDRARRACLD